jgi:hypothetical protein
MDQEKPSDGIHSGALAERFSLYSTGHLSRKDLEKETGLDFGDIIVEMRRLGLPLPRYDNRADFNDREKELYRKIFKGS